MVTLEIDTDLALDRRKLVTALRSARIRREATSVSRRNSAMPAPPGQRVAHIILRLISLPQNITRKF